MKTAILIQARSGSTRLPGKCFLPFGGVSMVHRVYLQAEQSGLPTYFVVPEKDEALQEHLKERHLPYLTGSEDDVRQRYREAARALQLDAIVRVTADNPFTDPDHIVRSVRRMETLSCDLFSYSDLPLGVGVELFTEKALATDCPPEKDVFREHVSLHIKHHPESFRVIHEPSPVMQAWREQTGFFGPLPRLTVDEVRDYETTLRVFERMRGNTLAELLDLFLADADLFAGNADVEQRRFVKE